jgi:hypothetical protein
MRQDLDSAWDAYGDDLNWFEAGEAENAAEVAAFGDSAPGSAVKASEARAAFRAAYAALDRREEEYLAVQGLCDFPA